MVVGVLRLELQLHAAQNLKEKRAIVRSLLGRCRERFPVSCCEAGHHELWQRTELAFVTVAAGSGSEIGALFARIEAEIERSGEVEVCERFDEMLHY